MTEETFFYCKCGVKFLVEDNGQEAIKIYCPKCKEYVLAGKELI